MVRHLALLALLWAPPAQPPAIEPERELEPEPRPESRPRRFLVGLEGVGTQVPVPRSDVFRIDPRFSGDSGTLIGLGLVGRYRPIELISLEATLRSGSIRYRREDGDTLLQDLLLADLGLILWLARGKVGQFGLDAGWGGAFNQIRTTFGEETSSQRYGSATFRAGADVELRGRRLAFIMALRGYGVLTDPRAVSNRGALFEGLAGSDVGGRAPSPVFQAWVAGSLGIAYRF